MANKIFRDMLNPQKKLVRNGFDRSYLNNFTAKIGELLPVMCVETVPGSHYEIKVADFMRTIPMRQAAFIRSNQHFDFILFLTSNCGDTLTIFILSVLCLQVL